MRSLLIITVLLILNCTSNNSSNGNISPFFPTSVDGLTIAVPADSVYIADGDTFSITVGYVAKSIKSRVLRMMAYNGSIPGPFITVNKGSTAYIRLINNLDITTTLHSHGLRLDNEFDGVPELTQEAIQPGKSFVYRIFFPDPGVYWYHPHIREDYTQELGLYGNFIVEPSDTAYYSKVDRQIPLLLDDIFLLSDSIPPFDNSITNYTLMGRYGNVMLINGTTDYRLKATQGEVIRFIFTNAASVRPFRIAIPGIRMKLVGSDLGNYAREEWVDSIIIGPAERFIIEALFADTGSFQIVNAGPSPAIPMGTISVESGTSSTSIASDFHSLRTNTTVIASVDSLRSYFTTPPDKRIVLTIDMDGMTSGDSAHIADGGVEWENEMIIMNILANSGNTHWKIVEPATGVANDQIKWTFTQGEFIKIRIFNDPESVHPMQHPIHFHGQRFIVTNVNGAEPSNFVWKDTYMVAAGDSVDLLIEMSNPGRWMAHCHISEHLSVNMMLYYDVTKLN